MKIPPYVWLILGYLVYANRSSFTLDRQEPIIWWIDPSTGQILPSPGTEPPAAGFRPASEYEVQQYASLEM